MDEEPTQIDADRMTLTVQEALKSAQARAENDSTAVGVPQLVLGLLEHDEISRRLFGEDGRNLAENQARMMVRPDLGAQPLMLEVLQQAQAFADRQHEPWVSVDHLLWALSHARPVRRTYGLSADAVSQAIADRRELARQALTPPPTPGPFDLLDRDRVLNMESILHERVISQNKAVHVVSSAIQRRMAGLADAGRPFGSFLFLGPTGVGKTELAKALAQFLYGNELAMIRLDMAEYQERHTVSRMIGSPPGYVGYEEGGQLTTPVAERPHSLVLLDEMEKAHPEVLNAMLSVLDDGRLTDSHGKTVDFKQTVVVMTSNVGSHLYQEKLSSSERRSLILKELWVAMKPEFLNRIDEIVVFDSLSKEDFGLIVDLQLAPVAARLAEQNLALDVDEASKEYLVEGGWNPVLGARQLRRFIQRELQDPLALKLLSAEHVGSDRVKVTRVDKGLVFGMEKV